MGISTSVGLASGLDVDAIVTSLMNVEKKPLTALATQKTTYQSKISAYGTLKSALSTFQTAVNNLSTASKFNAQTVKSGDPSVFTATASGSATVGNYAVTVSQLAQAQKIATAGFGSAYDVVGTGTMTIAFGTYDSTGNTFTANADKTPTNITISSANNTLAGVRDAINASGAGVTAAIVNDGTTNRLVITSKDTGEVNSLKITTTDSDGNNLDAAGLSQLAYDPTATAGAGNNMTQKQVAKNAKLNIDGIDIVKSSNTVSDAIDGVTFNLLKDSGGSAVSLDVARDEASVKASVTAFVDAYNTLNTKLRSLTNYSAPNSAANGPLLGDATARSVTSQIKSVLTSVIGTTGSITSLSQIGVGFKADGTLGLDATKLDKSIADNFGDIAKLFTSSATTTDPQISFSGSTSSTQAGTYAINISQIGSDSTNTAGTINGVAGTGANTTLTGAIGDASAGLRIEVNGGATGSRGTITYSVGYASKLNTLLTSLLSDDGILAARTDGINTSIKNIDKQSDAISTRLTAVEARYRAQFNKLETLISSMSSTSTYLTQQIAAINANK
ncbi:MAG: flagellar filament capping protein FliD [Pseudomonadota bacterium]